MLTFIHFILFLQLGIVIASKDWWGSRSYRVIHEPLVNTPNKGTIPSRSHSNETQVTGGRLQVSDSSSAGVMFVCNLKRRMGTYSMFECISKNLISIIMMTADKGQLPFYHQSQSWFSHSQATNRIAIPHLGMLVHRRSPRYFGQATQPDKY